MSKYIDAERLIAELTKMQFELNAAYRKPQSDSIIRAISLEYDDVISLITSLQQEQPEVDLDKLVNEEFASRSQITEYGPKVIYNRAELYQLIKRMALVFNARKEE